MARANVVVAVTVDGISYTATLVRRGDYPVTVEGSDGSRWEAEWEPEFQYMVSDAERSFSDATKEAIEAAIARGMVA